MVRSASLWARATVVAFSLLLSNQGGTNAHANHLFLKSMVRCMVFADLHTVHLWLPMATLITLLNYDFGFWQTLRG
jgi:hypothetical protein